MSSCFFLSSLLPSPKALSLGLSLEHNRLLNH
ncbi:hypothetical protein CoNPh17_CDS0013 [Staphylococcus phage S-CoN_Ph17]|nr:hypothetical protein CoNPh17_CDS0013 [Staphylococcus phage S-CoN_Ph17]